MSTVTLLINNLTTVTDILNCKMKTKFCRITKNNSAINSVSALQYLSAGWFQIFMLNVLNALIWTFHPHLSQWNTQIWNIVLKKNYWRAKTSSFISAKPVNLTDNLPSYRLMLILICVHILTFSFLFYRSLWERLWILHSEWSW